MSPLEREALEAKVERSLRRGELAEALALYRELENAFPHDRSLARRITELQENLQPAELTNPTSNFRSQPAASGIADAPLAAAETCASQGDYKGAIALYRRLMTERPDSELIRERLAELFELAQAGQSPPRPAAKALEAVLNDLISRINDRKR